jgi:DNA-binding transcriptional ArsR family regulator
MPLSPGSAGAPAVADAFGAIAHPVRRRILVELAAGPKPVRELAGGLPVSRPAVSQHLRLLRDVGIVTQHRVGRENRYQLHPERLDEVRQWLDQFDALWGSALARLREHLERNP